MRRLLHSSLSFDLGRLLWLTLRLLRACSPALRRPGVVTLSKRDCTVVFWPAKANTLSHRLERPATSSDMPSISSYRPTTYPSSRSSVISGARGVASGVAHLTIRFISSTLDFLLFQGISLALW